MKTFLISLFLLLMAGQALDSSEKAEPVTHDRHVPWGVYEMLTRRYSWEERLDHAAEDFGAQPRFVLFFRDLNTRRGFPVMQIQQANQRQIIPVISLEISQWGRGGDTGFLKEVAHGEFDEFFRDWAREANACNLPFFLRFGFEMNGDWFPWGSQPETFVLAWRRVHHIFRETGCQNVKWMFSPNVLWDKRTPKQDLYNYYPGDAYVDIVGLDGYNFGDNHDKWHRWQSYEEVFEKSIRACEKFNKPLFLSEVGCADDPRKAVWMRDFLAKVSQDHRISGFIYFNHHNPRKEEPNWRIDSDTDSLRIFRNWTKANDRAGSLVRE